MTKEIENRLDQSFRRHQPGLFRFVRSKLDSLEEAEDLVQDIYLQALTSFNVLDAVDNLADWLFTLAKNRVVDWYRRKKYPILSVDEENGERVLDELIDHYDDDWDEETWQLVTDALADSIEALPPKQRFAFVENVINGRTYQELAEETGESINTLLARKRYAVQFLKKRLHDLEKLVDEIER